MEIRELFIRFLNNACSPAEEQEVNRLLQKEEMLALLHELMLQKDMEETAAEEEIAEDMRPRMESWKEKIKSRISEAIIVNFDEADRLRMKRAKARMRYAAVVVGFLTLATGALFVLRNKKGPQAEFANGLPAVSPGTDHALLTLADGSTISLSEVKQGEIALESGVHIEKTDDGSIVYRGPDNQLAESTFNTIATPRGGQFQITLPDGSKAWLNASSTLSYPVRFAAAERRVKMTGEVYFEVAKQTKKNSHERVPFFVETEKQTIQVLGTQFNVNAYADEPAIRTTLVEGSVRIQGEGNMGSVLLKPGQQAVLTDVFKVSTVATEKEIAWKTGDFIFQGESLERILRELSRWYDVEVSCPEHLRSMRFNGMVSRKKPLSTIIEIIQSTNKVQITLEGRRLIVTN
ncbi:FecR family protein [Sphingobacterium sp. MYb382]|uniref:FecR family protein n=1 Tax=Sphingobacterium sp. MYb382 TaxID=2745278 RepID=UPI00309A3CEC